MKQIFHSIHPMTPMMVFVTFKLRFGPTRQAFVLAKLVGSNIRGLLASGYLSNRYTSKKTNGHPFTFLSHVQSFHTDAQLSSRTRTETGLKNFNRKMIERLPSPRSKPDALYHMRANRPGHRVYSAASKVTFTSGFHSTAACFSKKSVNSGSANDHAVLRRIWSAHQLFLCPP